MKKEKKLYIRIDEVMFEKLKKLAREKHSHVADIIRILIYRLLENKPIDLEIVKRLLPSYYKYIECDFCGKKFLRRAWLLSKNKHNFCSPECFRNYMKKKHRVKLKCIVCGKVFIMGLSEYKWRLKRRTKNTKDKWFCSKKCFGHWLGKNFRGVRKGIDLRKVIGPGIEHMTPKEIAEKIGYTRNYVYHLINKQKIKCIKKWSMEERLKKLMEEVKNEKI
jgi:hypothetical protein